MFKHVEMLRQEAQAKAMQVNEVFLSLLNLQASLWCVNWSFWDSSKVSSVVREKVEEAKTKVLGVASVKEKEEKVSEATSEVQ